MFTKSTSRRKHTRDNSIRRKLACAVEALEMRQLLAASIPDLVADSDTGFSAEDNITNDRTPTFSGMAAPATPVRLFANGVTVGQVVSNAEGRWSITASELQDGKYDVTAAEVINGREGPRSEGLLVRIDTIGPRASIPPVSPDPRTTPVGEVTINFAEPVVNFDKADAAINRNNTGPVAPLMEPVQASATSYKLDLSADTKLAGNYVLTVGVGNIQDVAGNPMAGPATEQFTVAPHVLFGTGGVDSFNVSLNDKQEIVVAVLLSTGQQQTQIFPKSSLGLVIDGRGGSDTIIIDFANGSPLPAGGIDIAPDPDAVPDQLQVRGTGRENLKFTYAASGQLIQVEGDSQIRASGMLLPYLEQLNNLELLLPVGSNQVSMTFSKVEIHLTTSTVQDVKTIKMQHVRSLTVNAGDGDDVVSMTGDATETQTQQIRLDLGAGQDQIYIDDFIIGVQTGLLVNGEGGNDLLRADLDNGLLLPAVQFNGGVGDDQMSLNFKGENTDRPQNLNYVGGDGTDGLDVNGTGRETVLWSVGGESDFKFFSGPMILHAEGVEAPELNIIAVLIGLLADHKNDLQIAAFGAPDTSVLQGRIGEQDYKLSFDQLGTLELRLGDFDNKVELLGAPDARNVVIVGGKGADELRLQSPQSRLDQTSDLQFIGNEGQDSIIILDSPSVILNPLSQNDIKGESRGFNSFFSGVELPLVQKAQLLTINAPGGASQASLNFTKGGGGLTNTTSVAGGEPISHTINFSEVSGLDLQLGDGDDKVALTGALDNIANTIGGGAGNDSVAVESLSLNFSKIVFTGGDGKDQFDVIGSDRESITAFPIAEGAGRLVMEQSELSFSETEGTSLQHLLRLEYITPGGADTVKVRADGIRTQISGFSQDGDNKINYFGGFNCWIANLVINTSLNGDANDRILLFGVGGGADAMSFVTGGGDDHVEVRNGRDDLVVGVDAGGPPHVKVFDGVTGAEVHSFRAYGGFTGGVRVAMGDITGDGVPDLITGAGAGAPGGHIKVFSGTTLAEVRSFFAFPPGFTGGVSVAAGDINGDGRADIITGASLGFGHIKVFDGQTGALLRSFAAFPESTGGVRVAAGDINGDGFDDIIAGYGSTALQGLVKVFDGRRSGELLRYFASFFNSEVNVHVAAGDINGDGRADIITGAGSSGGGQVKVFDGVGSGALSSSFFAYPGFTGGVTVAAGDVDGDGSVEIISGAGPGAGPHIKVFDGSGAEKSSFFAFDPAFRDGTFVAAGNIVGGEPLRGSLNFAGGVGTDTLKIVGDGRESAVISTVGEYDQKVQLGSFLLETDDVEAQDLSRLASLTEISPAGGQQFEVDFKDHLTQVQLSTRKAGGGQQEYLLIRMNDILITSFDAGKNDMDEADAVDVFNVVSNGNGGGGGRIEMRGGRGADQLNLMMNREGVVGSPGLLFDGGEGADEVVVNGTGTEEAVLEPQSFLDYKVTVDALTLHNLGVETAGFGSLSAVDVFMPQGENTLNFSSLPGGGTTISCSNNLLPTEQLSLNFEEIKALNIEGNSSNDTLSVNIVGVNPGDPNLPDGLNFNGGGGEDQLKIRGSGTETVVWSPLESNESKIEAGSLKIHGRGVETVDARIIAVLIGLLQPGENDVNFRSAADGSVLQSITDGTSNTILFGESYRFHLNAGNGDLAGKGNDDIQIESFSFGPPDGLFIDTGAGDDQVSLNVGAAEPAELVRGIHFNGGDGDDKMSLAGNGRAQATIHPALGSDIKIDFAAIGLESKDAEQFAFNAFAAVDYFLPGEKSEVVITYDPEDDNCPRGCSRASIVTLVGDGNQQKVLPTYVLTQVSHWSFLGNEHDSKATFSFAAGQTASGVGSWSYDGGGGKDEVRFIDSFEHTLIWDDTDIAHVDVEVSQNVFKGELVAIEPAFVDSFAHVRYLASGSDNKLELTANALGDGSVLHASSGDVGVPTESFSLNFSKVNALSIDAGGGDDQIELDFSAGPHVHPGGVNFEGGAGIDGVNVVGDGKQEYSFSVPLAPDAPAIIRLAGQETEIKYYAEGHRFDNVGALATLLPAIIDDYKLQLLGDGSVRFAGGTQGVPTETFSLNFSKLGVLEIDVSADDSKHISDTLEITDGTSNTLILFNGGAGPDNVSLLDGDTWLRTPEDPDVSVALSGDARLLLPAVQGHPSVQNFSAVDAQGTSQILIGLLVPAVQKAPAAAALLPAAPLLLTTNALTMSDSAKLDLVKGALLLRNGESQLPRLRRLIADGRNVQPGGVANGPWNGSRGILSSAAADDFKRSNKEVTVVGYALNKNLLAPFKTFFGAEVGENDVLMRYTRNGDVNLDTVVNNNDITVLAGFYRPGITGRDWQQGDLNGDSKVDNIDITILAGFYAPGAPPLVAPESPAPQALVFDDDDEAVPERGSVNDVLL